MLVKEMLEATGGKLICGNLEEDFIHFNKDTRTIEAGDFYIPIVGANFDGHAFIEQAFSKGASGCITSKEIDAVEGKTIILVKDTLKALQDMAAHLRKIRNVKVVAITGSVGKTSTKDMVYSVISKKYKTLKTLGNYNNEIGVPLTILRMQDEEVLVLEMGMDRLNLITHLSMIARPDICLITNVGTAHIGNLGSRENILKAKLEIIDGMQEDGVLIVNHDNDMLQVYAKEHEEVVSFGIDLVNDLSMDETKSSFVYEGYPMTVHVPGVHFVLNALAAIMVGKQLNIEMDLMKQGIEEFELTKKRMDFYKLKDGITYIDGTYNANVDSMKSSIDVLKKYESRKVAILADMLELGEYSKSLHEEVGYALLQANINVVLCVGKDAKYIVDVINDEHIITKHYACNSDLIDELDNYIQAGDTILAKGSQSMHLVEVSKYILEKYKN